MTKYVLGFMFDPDREKILLIEKNHPEWQNGQLNGVGGKIEKNESTIIAMHREFKEETGIEDFTIPWTLFCTMTVPKLAEVYCYKVFSDHVFDAISLTSEIIHLIDISDIYKYSFVKNVKSLITIALDPAIVNSSLTI